VQTQLLKEYPSEKLSIYAVWLQMLPSITSDQWDATIMPDPRVKHFWDGELDAAHWFAKQVDGYEGVSWDMYYLYGPDAVWESVPSPLVGSGGTIYREREVLMTQVSKMLGR
jgi:hypothetical protein